jgi:hypothetical protein
MTDKERKASIAESASNYMRGRAMALSFKPLALGDVKDAFLCGAEEMERLIDSSMWWKSADGSELPAIDREVIALTTEGKVVFAHRPKESWTGKNIVTGEVTTYHPKRYGAGHWNAPDIKWWLDIDIPLRGE